MHWFKIMLLVVLLAGVTLNLISTGKGDRTREVKASTEFICALWGTFILVGVWLWL